MVAAQLEQVDESVGLLPGREAGVAVVAADSLALDRAADLVCAELVPGVVPLPVLLLLADRHNRDVSAAAGQRNRIDLTTGCATRTVAGHDRSEPPIRTAR